MKPATKQLLEENNRRAEDLSPETQQVFTNLVCYLRGTSVPMEQQEQVRQDILNMLLEGEARGQSAREIIGEDDQAFCDAILAELPRRSTEQQTIYLLSIVSLCAAVLIAVWLGLSLFLALVQGPFTLWLPVRMGQLLGGAFLIVLSYGLVEYICRTSFAEEAHPPKFLIAALFLGMAAVLLLCFLLDQTVFSLHAGAAAALIAALYLIYKVTDRMEQ